MRGRRWFHVIATPRATVSFVKWTVNRSPRVLHRCAITIVPLTRHAISDRVYYATYLSIDVLRQCRTTACAPSEEEEAGRQAGACSPRAAARVSGWVCYYWFVFFLRRVSQPRISVKVAPPVCLCMYIYIYIVAVWERHVDDARDRCDRLPIFPVSRGRLVPRDIICNVCLFFFIRSIT